jgi:hypothetical protein
MERLLGYRPQVAVLDDAPSHPEALVDALAARAVRYMLVGANMFVSAPLLTRIPPTAGDPRFRDPKPLRHAIQPRKVAAHGDLRT